MKTTTKILVIVMIAIAVTSVMLTVFIPSDKGEIREDLHVGDYITLNNNDHGFSEIIQYEIVRFDDSGRLVVRQTADGSSTEDLMTKEQFIGLVKASGSIINEYNFGGTADISTEYGIKRCTLYTRNDEQYWVGDHNIIYVHCTDEKESLLVKTSLIIE